MSHVISEATLSTRWTDFWRQQFALPASAAQTRFDVAFGVVLPALYLALDPGLMNDSFVGSLFGNWSLAAEMVCTVCILVLAAWFLGGRNLPVLDTGFAGVLTAGSLVAFAFGVLLLPIVTILMLALVGVLGLAPFVTAFVYLRCAIRALRPAGSGPGATRRMALAGAFALALPAAAVCYQAAVDRTIEGAVAEIASPDPAVSSAAVHRMQQWRVLIPDAEIARLARVAGSGSREHYERGFALITGKPMTDRQRGGSD